MFQRRWSETGTNFVEAVNELKELVSKLDQEQIQQNMAYQGVKSNFYLPGTPHFHGIHKVKIKSVKKAIFAILGTSHITNVNLITIVAGVECLLNS